MTGQTKKIIIFPLSLLLLSLVLQYVINTGLKKSGYSNYHEWNDIFDSRIQANLLIQGSSRAWGQISPAVLDSFLHVNSYNLGLDGYGFSMQYYRFLACIKYNRKPDYIIQILDSFTLNRNEELYMGEQFIPYLNEPLIREATSQYVGAFNWKDYYVPLYRYTHDKNIALHGFVNFFALREKNNGRYKGFRAKDKNWDESFEQFRKQHPDGYFQKTDTQLIYRFNAFLKYCNQNRIKVILVFPPVYIEAQKLCKNFNDIIQLYDSMALENDIPFLNYANDSISYDKANFYNSQHMNAWGVTQYNPKLAKDLKRYIVS